MCAGAQKPRKGRVIILPYPPILFLPEVDWRVEAPGSCSCTGACFFALRMRQGPRIPDQLPAIAVLAGSSLDQRDQRQQRINESERERAETARGKTRLVQFDIEF